jgi:hypothetical protein
MDYLYGGCLLMTVVSFYGFCSCLILTEYQAKNKGILGWPARLIFSLLRGYHQAYAHICRLIKEEIDADFLLLGRYNVVVCCQKQTIIKHRVYDYTSRVKDEKNRTWMVLSRRELPNYFEVGTNGRIRPIKKNAV